MTSIGLKKRRADDVLFKCVEVAAGGRGEFQIGDGHAIPNANKYADDVGQSSRDNIGATCK